MNRHSEIVTVGGVSIETYVDGNGPAVVVLPSSGRDSGGRPSGGKPNEEGCMGRCPDRASPSPPAVVGTFPYNLLNGTAWARLLLYGN
jgi:hypothetical protein